MKMTFLILRVSFAVLLGLFLAVGPFAVFSYYDIVKKQALIPFPWAQLIAIVSFIGGLYFLTHFFTSKPSIQLSALLAISYQLSAKDNNSHQQSAFSFQLKTKTKTEAFEAFS